MSTHDDSPTGVLAGQHRSSTVVGATGGTDVGLLLLRLCLGGVFLAHGSQKLFGAFGGKGIDEFARMLQNTGYRESALLAWVTGITEFTGGLFLVLGLITPLAAAGIVGLMINTVTLHWNGGFFAPKGFEYDLVLGGMALCVLAAGPGRFALDNGRPWHRRPLGAGVFGLILAVVTASITLFVFRN